MQSIPEYAREYVDVLKGMLKDVLPIHYDLGAYTLAMYLWTDGDFKVELKCCVSTNDSSGKSHIFTWNKHVGYNHSVK